jgi:di/tricarboxylate transporter
MTKEVLMLLRILGEVVVGFLVAGIVVGIAVPAVMQFGYEPEPWLVWVGLAASIAVCVVIGERTNRRKKAPESS